MSAFVKKAPLPASKTSVVRGDPLKPLTTLVLEAGRGAFLTKADIKVAYKMFWVHSQDCHLLGVYWEKFICIDQTLLFGLRSVPKVFPAVAIALKSLKLNRLRWPCQRMTGNNN